MKNQEILNKLKKKSVTKQNVYNTNYDLFKSLKETTKKLVLELNKEESLKENNVIIKFKENNKFEFQLQFSGDVLIFHMHSNVFTFDKNHPIWKSSILESDSLSAYCGMINIYNFLNDSFKYKRLNDLGFLVGRLFINKDKCFFTEGKISTGNIEEFGKEVITDKILNEILNQLITFSIDFELLSPKFEEVQVVSVSEIIKMNNETKLKTSKKLGYKFTNEK